MGKQIWGRNCGCKVIHMGGLEFSLLLLPKVDSENHSFFILYLQVISASQEGKC